MYVISDWDLVSTDLKKIEITGRICKLRVCSHTGTLGGCGIQNSQFYDVNYSTESYDYRDVILIGNTVNRNGAVLGEETRQLASGRT